MTAESNGASAYLPVDNTGIWWRITYVHVELENE
jgi:hypothetical protein